MRPSLQAGYTPTLTSIRSRSSRGSKSSFAMMSSVMLAARGHDEMSHGTHTTRKWQR